MATSKAKTSRKSAPKASAKKASAKKASAKLDESRKIKAYVGQDEHFYTNKATGNLYPRGQAYQLLLKAKGRTMTVKAFLDKVESLPEVASRTQARGIVQKLVGKPNEAANKGRVCTFV